MTKNYATIMKLALGRCLSFTGIDLSPYLGPASFLGARHGCHIIKPGKNGRRLGRAGLGVPDDSYFVYQMRDYLRAEGCYEV